MEIHPRPVRRFNDGGRVQRAAGNARPKHRAQAALEVAMNLTEGRNLGWYLPAGSDELAADAREWMNSKEGDEALGRMENLYYAYIGDFDFVDLRALNRRIEDRLPNYIDLFRAAEQKTGIPADLLDARQLARDLGKNPDSWEDMEKVLPLKADKRYYPSTRYGYARGYEPVHYVQRIRNYRDIIRPAFQ